MALGLQPLTANQLQAVELTAKGLSIWEISQQTGLSEARILEARQLGEAWKATGVEVAGRSASPAEPESAETASEVVPAPAVQVQADRPLTMQVAQSIALMLDQAGQSDDEEVKAAAQGLLAAVARLKEMIAGSAERREARIAVEEAERQLALARERFAKLSPAAAVSVPRPRAQKTQKASGIGSGVQNAAKVREWARGAGIAVPPRGRLSAGVVAAYQDAIRGAAA